MAKYPKAPKVKPPSRKHPNYMKEADSGTRPSYRENKK